MKGEETTLARYYAKQAVKDDGEHKGSSYHPSKPGS